MGQCNLGYCMLKGSAYGPTRRRRCIGSEGRRRRSGQAMCLLGDCYREGQGVEADAAQARTCYKRPLTWASTPKEELEELDKAAPAGAAEQPKKKKSFLGRLFGK